MHRVTSRFAYTVRVYPYAIPFLLKIPHQIIYEGNYMARRQILSLSERESLLALMSVSKRSPEVKSRIW